MDTEQSAVGKYILITVLSLLGFGVVCCGGLFVVGDRLLEALRPRESFNFEPIQIESLQYGRDYFLGDLVTARYESIERDVQIETVNIQVQNGKELIRLGLRLVA